MKTAFPVKAGSQFMAEQAGKSIIIRLKPNCLDSRLSWRDRNQLGELMTQFQEVVLDLTDIGTTNGTQLYRIADWIEFVRSAGNALVLAHCSRPVLSMLGILRISRVVPVVADLREALACFETAPLAKAHYSA